MRTSRWWRVGVGTAGAATAVAGYGLAADTGTVLIVSGVVTLIGAVLYAPRTRRRQDRAPRRAGTPAAAPGDTWAGWVRGCSLAQDLARDIRPVARRLWTVVPRAGEYAYLVDLPVVYSRYGVGAHTPVTSTSPASRVYYYGCEPAYASGGIAFYTVASAICDAVESRRARDAAAARWRDHTATHVTLTDQRVLLAVAGRWTSIDIAAITAIYPDLAGGRIELHVEGGAPIRLEGTSVPSISAWLGWTLYGADGLRAHPRLRALLPYTHRL